jgi:uncharacterized glyoxalase superfamily protein PhnB
MAISTQHSTCIPGMMYRDAPAAIDWLCRVFGFSKHAAYAGPDNTIMHAELTLGGGMIMLGSRQADDQAPVPPAVGVSVIVDDADAVYARAKSAGAEMVIDIETKPYGGRGFSCRDREGYMWHVGTYDPWAPK